MRMKGVYRAGHLLAIFPTRHMAEKYLLPKTYKEFVQMQELTKEYGWLWEIKDVDVKVQEVTDD